MGALDPGLRRDDVWRAVASARLTFGDGVIVERRLRECNYGPAIIFLTPGK